MVEFKWLGLDTENNKLSTEEVDDTIDQMLEKLIVSIILEADI